jgi:thymidine phosphorylase
VCLAKRGDEIGVGEPLVRIHARDQASADAAADEVRAAYILGGSPPPERGIILEVVR